MTNLITVVNKFLTLTIKLPHLAMLTIQTSQMTENRELSTHTVRTVAKPTTPQGFVNLGPMQQ